MFEAAVAMACWQINNVFMVCLSVVIFASSCNRLSEADKQRLYLESLMQNVQAQDQAVSPPTGRPSTLLPAEADKGSKGFCGDGIINGDEYCDGTTLSDVACTEFLGLSGRLACKNDCKLDIRDCLTAATDKAIGGRSENCKCNCSGNNCDGGCAPRGAALGVSRCEYRCEQDCVCNCGELLQTHLERCDFQCDCTIDLSGFPQCVCNQDQCDILAITKPNIAVIAAQRLSGPQQ